ncbi:MAG: hypothetical protein JW814_00400 [Candidatus Krumholzibacteriota bacterium]|nr:hypothetical protein [Candidatus Krumholzibacteriota bacterium]
MNRIAGRKVLAALALAMVIGAGCSEKSDEKKMAGDDFRIPDSLLAPIAGYNLVRDDYHPIRGGVMANNDIELQYPASEIGRYIAVRNFGLVQTAYDIARERIGRPAKGRIVVVGAKDMSEYKFLTRKEWWYYGVMQGDTLYLEPLDVMLKRYDFVTKRTFAEIAILQKISQMALKNISAGRLPLWMREGTASTIANERPILQLQAFEFNKQMLGFNPTVDKLEDYLEIADDKAITRISFFIAYTMVENLLKSHSFEDIVSFAARLGRGESLDEASEGVFGIDYEALVEKVRLKKDFTYYIGELPEGMMVDRKDKNEHR